MILPGRQIARHHACYQDFRLHQRCLPPSTTIFVPVENFRLVAQATMASATSVGLAMRLSGVVVAILSVTSLPRPGTNSVSTTPGETAMTRISGASARPSDLVI